MRRWWSTMSIRGALSRLAHSRVGSQVGLPLTPRQLAFAESAVSWRSQTPSSRTSDNGVPPSAPAPAAAAPYGFEAADWTLAPDGAPSAAVPSRDAVPMIYVGAISDAQLPVLAAFLDAMRDLRHREPVRAARLRLELYGTTYATGSAMAPRAADLIRERGLQDLVVESPPRIPYVEALRLMAHAGANIVLGDTTRYYAASKLMPVLSARRPAPCGAS